MPKLIRHLVLRHSASSSLKTLGRLLKRQLVPLYQNQRRSSVRTLLQLNRTSNRTSNRTNSYTNSRYIRRPSDLDLDQEHYYRKSKMLQLQHALRMLVKGYVVVGATAEVEETAAALCIITAKCTLELAYLAINVTVRTLVTRELEKCTKARIVGIGRQELIRTRLLSVLAIRVLDITRIALHVLNIAEL